MIVTISFTTSGAGADISLSGITGYTGYEAIVTSREGWPSVPRDVKTGLIVNGGATSIFYADDNTCFTVFLTKDGLRTWVCVQNWSYNQDPRLIYYNENNAVDSNYREYSGHTMSDIACYVQEPPVSAINLSLQNNSTVQQIKYKVGAGAETTLNAGASAQISNLGNGAVLGVNPILSTRPITFNSNGRIASVGYNGVNYTQFPTNINVDVSGTPTITLNGTQAPTVTVNYSNTNDPVITNT